MRSPAATFMFPAHRHDRTRVIATRVRFRGYLRCVESFRGRLVSLQALKLRAVVVQLVVIVLLSACSGAHAPVATPTVTTTGHIIPPATVELIKGTFDYPICAELERIAGTIDSHGHLSGAMKTRLALAYESSRDSAPHGADDTLKAVLPSRNMSVPQLRTAVAYSMSRAVQRLERKPTT